MLEETCWVPCAACCTLREISCVAAPCSSTAAAMVDEIDNRSMVLLISLMAPLAQILGRRLDAGDLLADLAGRFCGLLRQRLYLGSHDREATTGLAGARLDRGVAARRLVCPAMVLISSTTSPMRAAAFDS